MRNIVHWIGSAMKHKQQLSPEQRRQEVLELAHEVRVAEPQGGTPGRKGNVRGASEEGGKGPRRSGPSDELYAVRRKPEQYPSPAHEQLDRDIRRDPMIARYFQGPGQHSRRLGAVTPGFLR